MIRCPVVAIGVVVDPWGPAVTTVPLRRWSPLGAAAAVTLALSACGTTAPRAAVEDQIRTQLGTATADCPDDLDGTVGALLTCAASDDVGPFEVTVTVTSVQGDTVAFDIERVGPVLVAAEDVEREVLAELSVPQGSRPDQVRCPDLAAELGATLTCELDAEGETYPVRVTVTAVRGSDVEFDIEMDPAPR